jgi:hypothetical protein
MTDHRPDQDRSVAPRSQRVRGARRLLVTYALRAQPLLLRARKTQSCSRPTERTGLTHTLRCSGQSAERIGRARTLGHTRRTIGIGGARVLRRSGKRAVRIAGANAARCSVRRRLSLVVRNAGTTRGLASAKVTSGGHLAHPVSGRTRTETGTVERSRSGGRIGSGQRWYR